MIESHCGTAVVFIMTVSVVHARHRELALLCRQPHNLPLENSKTSYFYSEL